MKTSRVNFQESSHSITNSPTYKDFSDENSNALLVASSMPFLQAQEKKMFQSMSASPQLSERSYSQQGFKDLLSPKRIFNYKRQNSIKKQMKMLDDMGFRSHFDKNALFLRGFASTDRKHTQPNTCMTDL